MAKTTMSPPDTPQVLILAGGLGTRLKPVTQSLPKPMVPVHDRPFLEYQIDWLRQTGFSCLLILVGYLGGQIEKYFGDGRRWGMSIRYSSEPSPLGTAGAIKRAEEMINPIFLVLNGDSLLRIDYRLPLKRFAELRCEGMVVAYDNPERIAPNNLSLSPDRHWAIRYHKTDSASLTHMDAGVYLFKKEVLQRIPPAEPRSLEFDLLPALARDGQLAAYPTNVRCYDMGTPERLVTLEQAVAPLGQKSS